jgi:hypothetical protein
MHRSSRSFLKSLGPVLLLLGACEGREVGTPPDSLPEVTSGSDTAHALTAWRLPKTTEDAAAHGDDLDGDGRIDNRFGAFLAALPGRGVDVELAGREALAAGTYQTFTVKADDPRSDPTVAVSIGLGPGGERFGGRLLGAIAAGRLDAAHGHLSVYVPLFPGQNLVELPLHSAHLSLSFEGFTCSGVLTGVITSQDLEELVIPVITDEFDAWAAEAPQVGTVPWWATKPRASDDGAIERDQMVRTLLESDLDRDGDQARDSLSVALPFTCAALLRPVPVPPRPNPPIAVPLPPPGT